MMVELVVLTVAFAGAARGIVVPSQGAATEVVDQTAEKIAVPKIDILDEFPDNSVASTIYGTPMPRDLPTGPGPEIVPTQVTGHITGFESTAMLGHGPEVPPSTTVQTPNQPVPTVEVRQDRPPWTIEKPTNPTHVVVPEGGDSNWPGVTSWIDRRDEVASTPKVLLGLPPSPYNPHKHKTRSLGDDWPGVTSWIDRRDEVVPTPNVRLGLPPSPYDPHKHKTTHRADDDWPGVTSWIDRRDEAGPTAKIDIGIEPPLTSPKHTQKTTSLGDDWPGVTSWIDRRNMAVATPKVDLGLPPSPYNPHKHKTTHHADDDWPGVTSWIDRKPRAEETGVPAATVVLDDQVQPLPTTFEKVRHEP